MTLNNSIEETIKKKWWEKWFAFLFFYFFILSSRTELKSYNDKDVCTWMGVEKNKIKIKKDSHFLTSCKLQNVYDTLDGKL